MMKRILAERVVEKLNESKILVLKGAKRSGRMTLLSSIIPLRSDEVLLLDGENKKERKEIDSLEKFKELSSGKRTIVLREAQLFVSLQQFIDYCLENSEIYNVVLLCSFEPVLQEELWEALRSQGLEISLFPLSYIESAQQLGLTSEEKSIEQRLIFGYYPEVVLQPEAAETILYDILESSIFTQLGATERINKRDQLIKLLRLLAFNIGKVISFNDLGKQCDLDNETVERYIKLFEKANLLFLLSSFNNGHRYELKKSHIVYFVDNGIRNALIRAFQPFEYRNDIPELWRNWAISERRKANAYANRSPEVYFWLTHTKQEIDYLEITSGEAIGYKLQWDKRKAIKVPASFLEAYPYIKVTGVNRSTFWSFVQKK